MFDSYAYGVTNDQAVQQFQDFDFLLEVFKRQQQINITVPGLGMRFGEAIRFISAFTELMKPLSIVDIGTSCGGSARSFLDFSPEEARVTTFDIQPWDTYQGTWLKKDDFKKLTQHLDDLSHPEAFKKHADLLANADLLYCDAPKDGVFEYAFIKQLASLPMPEKRRFLILDDIRFKNMASLWIGISSPKMDVTSFAHWSGTGLVNITNGLKT